MYLGVLCGGFVGAGVEAEVSDRYARPVRFEWGEIECLAVAGKDYMVGDVVVG